MSDNLRRYCAIQQGLKRLLPQEPTGHQARHLNTLAMLMGGLIGSRKAHLSAIASKTPDACKRESRIKRYERFIRKDKIEQATYYLPYAQLLLQSLPAAKPLALLMDASEVGRGCMALMLCVAYKGRALPLLWIVVSQKKGHLSEETHLALLKQALPLLPVGRSVVFLGDGEFDGTALLSAISRMGWQFVCRTAKNILLWEEGEAFTFSDLMLQPGDRIELPDVHFTKEAYGPLLAVAFWKPAHKEPLFLVSSFDFWWEAVSWYKRRFRIETFFSDQKSRGFGLHKSHLSDPKRLMRLLIACCLAYLWMVCLGAWVLQHRLLPIIHRTNRCDLSLFQIGLIWLDHCLDGDKTVPVCFQLPQLRRNPFCVR